MTNDTPDHNIRRSFDENLYVEREVEFATAKEWLQSTRRILTITSPPAYGKTWFMTRFHNFLRDEVTQNTFQIDVCDFLTSGSLGEREIDHAKMQAWTKTFAAELRKNCDSIPFMNAAVETAAMLNSLTGHISTQCWPGQPIYLFVDGGDEPSLASWKVVEKQILEPTLAHTNWHAIIPLRQYQRLHSHLLRQTEYRLELTNLDPLQTNEQAPPGHEQLEKLIKEASPSTPSLTELLSMLPSYNWTHLGLNYFLFLEACQNRLLDKKPLLGEDALEKGLGALATLTDTKQIVLWLKKINQLPKEWLIEDLSQILDLSRNDTWQVIKILQDYLLIISIDNRYQITPGVFGFVRSLLTPVEISVTPVQLSIRIDENFDKFTDHSQKDFIHKLSSALGVNVEQIKIIKVGQGSVIITLEMPKEYFDILLQLFINQNTQLDGLRLLEIKPNFSSGIALNQKTQQDLTKENENRKFQQKFRQDLRKKMEAYFNLLELRTLCFDLTIDYENFESTKNPTVIGIIEYCERHKQLSNLLSYLAKEKSNITWPTIP